MKEALTGPLYSPWLVTCKFANPGMDGGAENESAPILPRAGLGRIFFAPAMFEGTGFQFCLFPNAVSYIVSLINCFLCEGLSSRSDRSNELKSSPASSSSSC